MVVSVDDQLQMRLGLFVGLIEFAFDCRVFEGRGSSARLDLSSRVVGLCQAMLDAVLVADTTLENLAVSRIPRSKVANRTTTPQDQTFNWYP